MAAISVSVLGRLRIEAPARAASALEAGKAQSIFCFLLLHRDRPHLREALAGRFWEGEGTTAVAKKQLRQALWHLQNALDDQSQPSPERVLLVEPDWVRVNPQVDLWLDAQEFESAFHRVRDVPGEALDQESAGNLEDALALYGGELLEGCYDDWCLFERERLQNIMLTMLDKLMGFCEAHMCYEKGVRHGERILGYDRASERTHRRLMRMYHLGGDRTSALRQFERCSAWLQEELGVEPSSHTRLVYEQIKAGHDDVTRERAALSVQVPPADPSAPTHANDHLQRLEMNLTSLQREVSATLQALRFAQANSPDQAP